MKNFKLLFVLLLGGFFFIFSCQKDENAPALSQQAASIHMEDEFSTAEEFVDYYLQVIEDQKKIGSSVVFQDGDKFVENPGRAWLKEYFASKDKKGGDDCEYCYWFEYRATVPTSFGGYRAFDTAFPSGPPVWGQTINHPVGGWPANTIFISNEFCLENPPPCINIRWAVTPVVDTGGTYCDFFRVRVRRPCGGTQTRADVGTIPIPPPSGTWSLDSFCVVQDTCPCPEPCDLPPVFICCTDWGFCLFDSPDCKGNQLSQSPLFTNTAILWSAPSQYAGYTGECLSFDHDPGPLPNPGDTLRFTIRRGECFEEYELIYDCDKKE